MNVRQNPITPCLNLLRFIFTVFMASPLTVPALGQPGAASVVSVWDTMKPFGPAVDIENRAAWRIVPSDLLSLESDPLKASSDPAYYGREYAFAGDAVVENNELTAVFWAAGGRVIVYPKTDFQPSNTLGEMPVHAKKAYKIVPLSLKTDPVRLRTGVIIRNAGDEVVLAVSFSGVRNSDLSTIFAFDKTEIVEVRPAKEIQGISVATSIEHGIAPSFLADDLIYTPSRYPSIEMLPVPSENLFLGLMTGEQSTLVMTWPIGNQRMQLVLGNNRDGRRVIESIDFENDGKSVYLAALVAPGIWHREALKPNYLEKDIQIQWKQPFPANWVTQLNEDRVKTTFAFRNAKSQIWRGVPGMYSYPVWFAGTDAFYHLSKKVPPKGDSLIYYLEGKSTPASISTPVEIMKQTLGRQMCESILDVAGRKLRSHHRRGSEGVRRACTCGATDAIQAIFQAGKEFESKTDIGDALDDMIYFVQKHVERIDEYQSFAGDMIKYLRKARIGSPDLAQYIASMEKIVTKIPRECEIQKDNMKSLGHADELARQTIALAARSNPDNLKAYMDLLKAWRAMGGAQDYVLAQCHTITRNLFQQAGYECVNHPAAIEVAQEIRRRCKDGLRNPDGYEIWPNY